MSARPSWLTDAMLDEMRRLKGTSFDNPMPDSAQSDALWKKSYDLGDDWVDGFGPRHSRHPNHSWLELAGHKALAAIEAEVMISECKGPTPRYIRVGDTVHVTNTEGLPEMDRYIGVSGVVTKVLDYECSEMVLFESGEGLVKLEYMLPWHILAKPCPNCDHGHGPSGLTMFGMRCSVCDGAKVAG